MVRDVNTERKCRVLHRAAPAPGRWWVCLSTSLATNTSTGRGPPCCLVPRCLLEREYGVLLHVPWLCSRCCCYDTKLW